MPPVLTPLGATGAQTFFYIFATSNATFVYSL